MSIFKISELSKKTGINIETIRYYEKIGAINKASRGENAYRYFNQHAIEQLEFIKTCRSLGFTMQEIKAFNQLIKIFWSFSFKKHFLFCCWMNKTQAFCM